MFSSAFEHSLFIFGQSFGIGRAQKRAPTRDAPTEAMGNESSAKKSGLIVQVQSVRTNPGIDRVNVIVGATLVVARWDGKGLGPYGRNRRGTYSDRATQWRNKGWTEAGSSAKTLAGSDGTAFSLRPVSSDRRRRSSEPGRKTSTLSHQGA